MAAPADNASTHNASTPHNASTLYAGELEIRLGEGLVLATGQALTLSVREFELLAAMARRAGAIVTRDELYAEVWGGELRVGDRSVDVYVSKLRTKLEAAMPDRRFIHTHPGFGYRFQPQPARVDGMGSAGASAVGAGVSVGSTGMSMGSTAGTGGAVGAGSTGVSMSSIGDTGGSGTSAGSTDLSMSSMGDTGGAVGAGSTGVSAGSAGTSAVGTVGAVGAVDPVGTERAAGPPEELSRNVHIGAVED